MSEPLRLKHDGEASERLRAALGALGAHELPSREQLRDLWAAIELRRDEPERLLESSSTTPELRGALRGFGAGEPSAEELASLKREVWVSVEPPRLPVPSAWRRVRRRRVSRVTGVAVALIASCAAAAVTWLAVENRRSAAEKKDATSAPVQRAREPLVSKALDAESTPDEMDGPTSAPAPTAEPEPPSSAAPAPEASKLRLHRDPDVDPLTELSLIERARRIRRENPVGALELAQGHRQQFPGGVLAQERDVIIIEACIALGRHYQAREEWARFRKLYPGSPHLARIESLMARMEDVGRAPRDPGSKK